MKTNSINTLGDALKIIINLQIELSNSQIELAKLKLEYENLRCHTKWLEKQFFGPKSEALQHPVDVNPYLPGFGPDQPDPSEETAEKPEESSAGEDKTGKTKKSGDKKQRTDFGWNDLPESLPRKDIVIDVPEEEREGMQFIGYSETERLAKCTSFYVLRIKRAKYAYPDNPEKGILTAPAPGNTFGDESGRTKFDTSFVTSVVVDKVENHLPLYRQSEMMLREGINVNRSTLIYLFGRTAEYLKRIYDRMEELVNQCDIIHGDETPVRMLQPGTGKCKKGYMWVKMTALGPPIVVFRYADSRRQEVAESFYKDYYGTIVRDNYVGYDNLAAGHAGCWAHVRRRFFEADQAGYSHAQVFLKIIGLLYSFEKSAKERADLKESENALYAERRLIRKKSVTFVQEFFDKCRNLADTQLPDTPLHKAANYALNQKEALEKFLHDPRLNIDNNPAENVIRPIALGRKNWLFAGSLEGGQNLAMFESYRATCQKNGINFRDWMNDVLRRLPDMPNKNIDPLLPQNWHPAE